MRRVARVGLASSFIAILPLFLLGPVAGIALLCCWLLSVLGWQTVVQSRLRGGIQAALSAFSEEEAEVLNFVSAAWRGAPVYRTAPARLSDDRAFDRERKRNPVDIRGITHGQLGEIELVPPGLDDERAQLVAKLLCCSPWLLEKTQCIKP